MKPQVSLADSKVIYLDNASIRYEIPLSQICVVGEATNESGPYQDDWFLCLGNEDTWYEVSVYSRDFEKFLEELSEYLGVPLALTLSGSTDFNSRVLWPPKLKEQSMFQYKSKFLSMRVNVFYSDAVLKHLKSGVGKHHDGIQSLNNRCCE